MIKMSNVAVMCHEQTSLKKAKEDVKKLIENSSKETIDKIFTSKPKFIYTARKTGNISNE